MSPCVPCVLCVRIHVQRGALASFTGSSLRELARLFGRALTLCAIPIQSIRGRPCPRVPDTPPPTPCRRPINSSPLLRAHAPTRPCRQACPAPTNPHLQRSHLAFPRAAGTLLALSLLPRARLLARAPPWRSTPRRAWLARLPSIIRLRSSLSRATLALRVKSSQCRT